jgi:hypothetical protein
MENLVDPYMEVSFYIDIIVVQNFPLCLSLQLRTGCSERKNNDDNVTEIQLIRELCNVFKSSAKFQ